MPTPLRYRPSLLPLIASLQLGCAALCVVHADDVLHAEPPITLTGTHGKFDFLSIDPARRRLLAAHTGNGTLDIVDLDRHELLQTVEAGKAQSSAVDAGAGRYYVATSVPPQLVTIDAVAMKVLGSVTLSGPGDLLAFDSKTGLVYVGHDDGQELWVVNPARKKVTATIKLPGEAPEDLAFDASHQRLFQSLKTESIVAVFDVATGKVAQTWPTAPAKAPHGMAIVPEADAFLVAGGNGKLALLSQKDGHVIASTDIPERVDQIAYDPDLHRVYCASGTGKIAIVSLAGDQLHNLGEVTSAEGAHSIAVDPKTHVVWIAFAKGDASFVQAFTPSK